LQVINAISSRHAFFKATRSRFVHSYTDVVIDNKIAGYDASSLFVITSNDGLERRRPKREMRFL
jgi:hypothetical protein